MLVSVLVKVQMGNKKEYFLQMLIMALFVSECIGKRLFFELPVVINESHIPVSKETQDGNLHHRFLWNRY